MLIIHFSEIKKKKKIHARNNNKVYYNSIKTSSIFHLTK